MYIYINERYQRRVSEFYFDFRISSQIFHQGLNVSFYQLTKFTNCQTAKSKNTDTVVKVYLGIETVVDRECNHRCKILQITNKLHWFQMRSCITSDVSVTLTMSKWSKLLRSLFSFLYSRSLIFHPCKYSNWKLTLVSLNAGTIQLLASSDHWNITKKNKTSPVE